MSGKYSETTRWLLTYEWVSGTLEMQPKQKGIIEHLHSTALLRIEVKVHDISFASHVTRNISSPQRGFSHQFLCPQGCPCATTKKGTFKLTH